MLVHGAEMVLVDASASTVEDVGDEVSLPVLRRVVLRLHPGLSDLVIHGTPDVSTTPADVPAPALALAVTEITHIVCGRLSPQLAKAAEVTGDASLVDRVLAIEVAQPQDGTVYVWSRRSQRAGACRR